MGSSKSQVTPYLLVHGVDRVIDFCTTVFGATELGRLTRPEGTIMHAEINVLGSTVMLGEPMGEFGPAPGWIFLRVDDCDAIYARALDAGAESVMEVTDMHHAGERYGGVRDSGGNVWWISTTTEAVPWPEQQRRIDGLVEQDLGR